MIPKFRAWDKEHESWIDIKSLGIMEGEITTLEEWDDDLPYFIEDLGKTWELIQSTGLHDKNGKEIFEGDIVKALSEGYCGTFQVKWRNGGTPMYILYPAWQNEQFWDLKGVNGVDDGIEIIGNIHEHPELLGNI